MEKLVLKMGFWKLKIILYPIKLAYIFSNEDNPMKPWLEEIEKPFLYDDPMLASDWEWVRASSSLKKNLCQIQETYNRMRYQNCARAWNHQYQYQIIRPNNSPLSCASFWRQW